MKRIHKYTLQIADVQKIDMPHGAKLLAVQVQDGTICLWAEVDRANVSTSRIICIAGTGHEVPALGNTKVAYVGTVQQGNFVWHVYDAGEA